MYKINQCMGPRFYKHSAFESIRDAPGVLDKEYLINSLMKECGFTVSEIHAFFANNSWELIIIIDILIFYILPK